MFESTHSPLTSVDAADIQSARLTIERHLSGFDDADLPRAAAMLRAVLERHGILSREDSSDDSDSSDTSRRDGGQS